MDRRSFLAAAAAASLRGDDSKPKLLLPSDEPDEYGFRIMWHNPTPALDRAAYKLQIKGLCDKPQVYTLDELHKLPQETQSSRMKCVQCWSSRAEWSGFRFGHLLESAKPHKQAKAVRFDCADKWYEYFTIEELLSPRFLFVLGMAGKPLPDRHGGPLRLIDPARYGYRSAKLVTSLEFVTEGKGSMACDIGPYYSPSGEIQPSYDKPLDIGGKRRPIPGGEITEY